MPALTPEISQEVDVDSQPVKRKRGRPKGSKNKSTLAHEAPLQDDTVTPKKRKSEEEHSVQSGWKLNLETLQWDRVAPRPSPSNSKSDPRSRPPSLTPATPIPYTLLAKALLYEPRTEYQTKSKALEATTHAFSSYRRVHPAAITPWGSGRDALYHESEKVNFGCSWVVVADPELFKTGLENLEEELREVAMEVVSASCVPMP